jgi:L-threonylcarbamoyladenylate synthase
MDASSGTDLKRAAEVLRTGGLVIFPTETVYGLGARADSREAVGQIFEAKGRPKSHPVIVHLSGAGQLARWAARVPRVAEVLAEAFWPGPLTIVLERSAALLAEAAGGLPTVGLRVPSHPLALALLGEVGLPIAAPSANLFTAVSPTRISHIDPRLAARVDYILDGGPCGVGLESTIVDVTGERPRLLRPGGIPREAIEALLGQELLGAEGANRAPGAHPLHYAPRAELVIVSPEGVAEAAREALLAGKKVAVLSGAKPHDLPASVHLRVLGEEQLSYARELYAALHELDAEEPDVILSTLPSSAGGLGLAIIDRLNKAAGPRS